MNYQIKSLFVAAALSLLTFTAEAALIDRGNGLIYDNDLNITWLQDANFAKTSEFDNDGRLSWADANAWAEQLTVAGFSDWRLPRLTSSTDCIGANCSHSELEHLLNGELGGESEAGLALQHNSNYALFNNLHPSVYWLKNELADAPGLSLGWGFATNRGIHGGYQDVYHEAREFHVWAVHDGDIGANISPSSVPAPAAAWLFASGLLGVLGIRSKKRGL